MVEEISNWLRKELDSLEGSSLRIALLTVIKLFQDKGGIYGYKISEKLIEYSQGELDASNATFYAILRRLEKDSLISSQIQPSDAGPNRKHYYLTEDGMEVLNSLYQHWDYHHSVIQIMRNIQMGDMK